MYTKSLNASSFCWKVYGYFPSVISRKEPFAALRKALFGFFAYAFSFWSLIEIDSKIVFIKY